MSIPIFLKCAWLGPSLLPSKTAIAARERGKERTLTTQSWLPHYTGMPVSRRKFIAGAAAGAGAAALIACGGSSGGGGLKFDDSATARKPGTVWNAANDWK